MKRKYLLLLTTLIAVSSIQALELNKIGETIKNDSNKQIEQEASKKIEDKLNALQGKPKGIDLNKVKKDITNTSNKQIEQEASKKIESALEMFQWNSKAINLNELLVKTLNIKELNKIIDELNTKLLTETSNDKIQAYKTILKLIENYRNKVVQDKMQLNNVLNNNIIEVTNKEANANLQTAINWFIAKVENIKLEYWNVKNETELENLFNKSLDLLNEISTFAVLEKDNLTKKDLTTLNTLNSELSQLSKKMQTALLKYYKTNLKLLD